MTRLPFGQITIHEVEVAAERAVEERRAVGCGHTATDKRGDGSALERSRELSDCPYGGGGQCADGDADGVEHSNLKLFQGLIAQILQARSTHVLCQYLYLGHGDVTSMSCRRVNQDDQWLSRRSGRRQLMQRGGAAPTATCVRLPQGGF